MTSNRSLLGSALSLAVLVPALALAGPSSPTTDRHALSCTDAQAMHAMRGAQHMADMRPMHQMKGTHAMVGMHAAARSPDAAATPAAPNMTSQDLQQIWSAP